MYYRRTIHIHIQLYSVDQSEPVAEPCRHAVVAAERGQAEVRAVGECKLHKLKPALETGVFLWSGFESVIEPGRAFNFSTIVQLAPSYRAPHAGYLHGRHAVGVQVGSI